MVKCFYVDLGVIGYQEALDLQYKLVELRGNDRIEDVLLLLEHHPVITVGAKYDYRKNGEFFKVQIEEIEKRGVRLVNSSRGGKVTYHGPGQLVGYPIIDFTRRASRGGEYEKNQYMLDLGTVMMQAAADYGIDKLSWEQGMWHNNSKLGSTGVEIKQFPQRRVTMHGFALDVNTQLEHFNLIHPCGHTDRDVTSMQKILGRFLEMDDIKSKVVKHFGEVFGYEMERNSLDALGLAASAD